MSYDTGHASDEHAGALDIDSIWNSIALEEFRSLVPSRVLRRIAERDEALALVPLNGELLRVHGSVMMIDISGFTSITAALNQLGPEGAEVLSDELNRYYRRIIDTIYEHGGDVTSFSGDALIALWETSSDTPHGEAELRTQLSASLLDAVLCATKLAEFTQSISSINAELNLHIGVSSGKILFAVVGGRGSNVMGKWKSTLVGDPVNEAAVAVNIAERREVALPAQAADALNILFPDLTLIEKKEDFFLISTSELMAHHSKTIAQPSNSLSLYAPPMQLTRRESCYSRMDIDIEIDADISLIVSSFAFDTVAVTLAGQSHGELRSVVSVFVRLSGMTTLTFERNEDFQRLNKAVTTVQKALLASQGILNKVCVDDRGVLLLCLFGLPRHTHEDDPERAVAFAIKIVPRLLRVVGNVSIGISRAKVFCGLTGSRKRRDYTVVGDGVNIAAALMVAGAASTESEILTDEDVMQKVSPQARTLNVTFRTASNFHIKGHGQATVYQVEPGVGDGFAQTMSSVGVALEAVEDPARNGTGKRGKNNRVGRLPRGPSSESWTMDQKSDGQKRGSSSSPKRPAANRKVVASGRRKSSSESLPHKRMARKKKWGSVASSETDGSSMSGALKSAMSAPGGRSRLWGRQQEFNALMTMIQSCVNNAASSPSVNFRGHANCLYFRGDMQMGKSAILATAAEIASHFNVPFKTLRGSEATMGTPYATVAPLVQYFMDTTPFQFIEMGFHPAELRAQLPLLHHILRIPGLALPTEEHAQLTSNQKMAYLNQILKILTKKFLTDRCVLIVDDLQWTDGFSLSFLRETAESGGTLILASRVHQVSVRKRAHSFLSQEEHLSRTSDDSDEGEGLSHFGCHEQGINEVRAFDDMLLSPLVHQFVLRGLSTKSLSGLCCALIGCERMCSTLEALLAQKSDGRPGFATQIVAALLAAGLVNVQGKTAFATEGREYAEVIVHSVPTVEAQVLQVMDTLPDYQRQVAMMLAVLGRSSVELLEHCVSSNTGAGAFSQALKALQGLNLLKRAKVQNVRPPGRKSMGSSVASQPSETQASSGDLLSQGQAMSSYRLNKPQLRVSNMQNSSCNGSESSYQGDSLEDEVRFSLSLARDVIYYNSLLKVRRRLHSVVVRTVVGNVSLSNDVFCEHLSKSAITDEELTNLKRGAFFERKECDDINGCLAAYSRPLSQAVRSTKLDVFTLVDVGLHLECGHINKAKDILSQVRFRRVSKCARNTSEESTTRCFCFKGEPKPVSEPQPQVLTNATCLELQYLFLQLETELWDGNVGGINKARAGLLQISAMNPGYVELADLLAAVDTVCGNTTKFSNPPSTAPEVLKRMFPTASNVGDLEVSSEGDAVPHNISAPDSMFLLPVENCQPHTSPKVSEKVTCKKRGTLYSPYLIMAATAGWDCLHVLDVVNRSQQPAVHNAVPAVFAYCKTVMGGNLFFLPIPLLQERILEALHRPVLKERRFSLAASVERSFMMAGSNSGGKNYEPAPVTMLTSPDLEQRSSSGERNSPQNRHSPTFNRARHRPSFATSMHNPKSPSALIARSRKRPSYKPGAVDNAETTSSAQGTTKGCALPAGGFPRRSLKEVAVLCLCSTVACLGEQVGALDPHYFTGLGNTAWPILLVVHKLSTVVSCSEAGLPGWLMHMNTAWSRQGCAHAQDDPDATSQLLQMALQGLVFAREGRVWDVRATLKHVQNNAAVVTPLHGLALFALSEALMLSMQLDASGSEDPRRTLSKTPSSYLDLLDETCPEAFLLTHYQGDTSNYLRAMLSLLGSTAALYPGVSPAFNLMMALYHEDLAQKRKHLVDVLRTSRSLGAPSCAVALRARACLLLLAIEDDNNTDIVQEACDEHPALHSDMAMMELCGRLASEIEERKVNPPELTLLMEYAMKEGCD